MKLYIIRHGETMWNKEKKLQGQTDIPLNEEGIRLAKETGQKLKDIPFDLVITSPLERARKTAELFVAGRDIPFIEDKRLIEISFGDWEGECIVDSQKMPDDFRTLFHYDPLHCPMAPHGETFQNVLTRTKDLYEELCKNEAYQDANIILSSHGASSRCFLANFYEDKTDIWRGCVPPNCSVSIVEVHNGIGTILEKDKLYT